MAEGQRGVTILGISVADLAFGARRMPADGARIAGRRGADEPTGAAVIYVNDSPGQNTIILVPGPAGR